MHNRENRLLFWGLFVQFCISMITVGVLHKVSDMSWLSAFLYATIIISAPSLWYFYVGFVVSAELSKKDAPEKLPPNHCLIVLDYHVNCPEKPSRLWGDTFFDSDKGKLA